MTNKIFSIEGCECIYDDGNSTKELKQRFKSSVYGSLDEYMNDLYWLSKPDSDVVNRIQAERRLDKHYQENGTKFDLVNVPFNVKKPSH